MSIRKIVLLDDPILRQKARRVRDFDAELGRLLDDMTQTMLDAPGVGLAAPQVGISQRVIVVQVPNDEEGQEEYGDQAGVIHQLVNPEIVRTSREMVDGVEACLSIPGYFGQVDRHTELIVRAQDRHGKEVRVKAHGWLARIFQHEIDHLDGVLFIDRASEVWRAQERPSSEAGDTAQPAGQLPSAGDEV